MNDAAPRLKASTAALRPSQSRRFAAEGSAPGFLDADNRVLLKHTLMSGFDAALPLLLPSTVRYERDLPWHSNSGELISSNSTVCSTKTSVSSATPHAGLSKT